MPISEPAVDPAVDPAVEQAVGPAAELATEPPTRGWRARLDLEFAARAGSTRLTSNRHVGPLRLIRALAGPQGCCHAVIVHPPGGLVGGDRLDLSVRLGPASHVLCTTPGAQKWYRSLGERACSTTRIEVADAAVLEWLPQPAIVFDSANAEQAVEFDLAANARMIGWECVVLGRAAMAERFLQGSLRQRLALRLGGRPAWAEQSFARAGDRLFASPLGWGGRTVSATVWAVGPAEGLLEAWRGALDAARDGTPGLDAGASRVAATLHVARLLADDSEAVMNAAQALWRLARPQIAGVAAESPRIWST